MARFIITGEYKDKATKAARKDLKGLGQDFLNVSKISKKYYAAATAAASYYSQKVLRDSIKNALDDEKSQRVLALTLGNVANATDAAIISTEQQIAAMQRAYGIMDDKLRPALARLARSSGSASQAAYDLKLALDISAATGKSLESVTGALGKALDGNYASLQRLGLGLDASLLKTKDQKKIFDQLRKTFAGFAAGEAKTTEGKFRRIAVAADDAKEIIGTALIDSINNLIDSQGNINDLAKSFDNLAYAIGDTIRGLTTLAGISKSFTQKFNLDFVQAIPVLGSWLKIFQGIGKQQRINLALQKSITTQHISARNAEWAALNAKKEANKVTQDGTQKTVEQLMAEEAARKAGFKLTEDLDSIQTVAAAKRLEESRQYKMSVLDAAQSQFEAIKNNYDLLNAVWTTQLAAFDVFLAALKTKAKANPIGLDLYSTYIGSGAAGMAPMANQPNYMGFEDPLSMSLGMNQGSISGAPSTNIVVNVTAGAVGDEQLLSETIIRALTNATRNGLSTTPAGYLT